MDTAPLRDAVRGIDEAAKQCHPHHKAGVECLQSFFRETVEQVHTFLTKVEELGLLDDATIDAKLITASLGRCLTYVEERRSDRVWLYIFQCALMPTSQTSYSVTSQDLQSEARAAVREGIIEPVIIPLEVCKYQGSKYRAFFTEIQVTMSWWNLL